MKKFITLLCSSLMVLSLVGCGGSKKEETAAPEASGDVSTDPAVTLVYAEVNPETTTVGQIAAAFKEKVEELSGGSVTIDVQYSGVLGSENDVLDSMLSEGDTVDISRISAFALNSYGAEKSKLLSLPYTFANREHFWKFAKSDLAEEILNEAADNLPVRGLFYGEEGFRHFFTKNEVSSYKDLAGMKIRVSNDPIMNGMVEALSASPTVVAFGELYSALQTGVVDAAEQPITNYQSNAFPEVAPNLLLDGHTLGAIEIIIADAAWDKLTPAQQDCIVEAAKYVQEVNQKIAAEADERVLGELKAAGVNVVEVSDADKAALADLVKDIVAENASGDLKDVYDQIVAMK